MIHVSTPRFKRGAAAPARLVRSHLQAASTRWHLDRLMRIPFKRERENTPPTKQRSKCFLPESTAQVQWSPARRRLHTSPTARLLPPPALQIAVAVHPCTTKNILFLACEHVSVQLPCERSIREPAAASASATSRARCSPAIAALASASSHRSRPTSYEDNGT